MTEEDKMEVLPAQRGDSFDVGMPRRTASGWEYPGENEPKTPQEVLVNLISNPGKFAGNVDERQLRNIRGAMVGLGSVGVHRFLSGIFGDAIAGAIGGGLAGFLAGKMFPSSLANTIEKIFQQNPNAREQFRQYREEYDNGVRNQGFGGGRGEGDIGD